MRLATNCVRRTIHCWQIGIEPENPPVPRDEEARVIDSNTISLFYFFDKGVELNHRCRSFQVENRPRDSGLRNDSRLSNSGTNFIFQIMAFGIGRRAPAWIETAQDGFGQLLYYLRILALKGYPGMAPVLGPAAKVDLKTTRNERKTRVSYPGHHEVITRT
jgi:hypothetical protein